MSSPRKRKGRAGTARPSHNLNRISGATDTIETGRTQRVMRLCGLAESRARLVASLAWEAGNG